MPAGFVDICHNESCSSHIDVNIDTRGVGMFTNILLTVALSQVVLNPIPVNSTPITQLEPRAVQSQAVSFDAISLHADIHAELMQQIEQLSQAISHNIEKGILPTAPAELITVKD